MCPKMKLIVAMSGASGAIYGIRIIETLYQAGIETHLVISDAAKRTISLETNYTPSKIEKLASYVYDCRDIGAAIASGSFKTSGMIIAPCSIKTLSALAHSYNDNLINRSADVILKEKRKLVVVPRETPYNGPQCQDTIFKIQSDTM